MQMNNDKVRSPESELPSVIFHWSLVIFFHSALSGREKKCIAGFQSAKVVLTQKELSRLRCRRDAGATIFSHDLRLRGEILWLRLCHCALITIHHGTGKLRLRHQHSIHQSLPSHAVIIPAMLEDCNLQPQLIPGNHGLPKTAVVDAREIDKFGSALFVVMEEKNDTYLGQRFDQQDAGHDRGTRKVALKEGLIYGHVLDAHHSLGTIGLDDSVYQEKGIPVRQYVEDVLDVFQLVGTFHSLLRDAAASKR